MKTDAQLQKDVMDELKWQPILSACQIGVAVKNGIAELSGTVDSYAEKKAAETAAFKVSGIKGITENIKINLGFGSQKNDVELAETVINALKWNVLIPSDDIKVKVENGWVTTDGQVDWDYQRKAVKDTIEHLTGVKGLTNTISLAPRVHVSDVKNKIREAFERHAVIDANNIKVECNGSKVTLKGTVRSYVEKEDAEREAWNAPGVHSVENELEVKILTHLATL